MLRALVVCILVLRATPVAVELLEHVIHFVDDARIPLDNNATERGIRGPVVGRRNHFGSKSRRGTEVAATLYTLVETAKLHDIDPAAYLHAAITTHEGCDSHESGVEADGKHRPDPEHGCTPLTHRCACCQSHAVLSGTVADARPTDNERTTVFMTSEPNAEPDLGALLRPPIA